MNIYRCRLDSRNFSFEAFGATKEEALTAFARGLRVHANQYGATQEWVDESIMQAEPERIAIGKCYRDGEALPA